MLVLVVRLVGLVGSRHAPGVLALAQNRYGLGGGERGSMRGVWGWGGEEGVRGVGWSGGLGDG